MNYPLYADQGAGFNIIISAICYQIFYCLPGQRKELNLVKNDYGPPFRQFFSFNDKQIAKKSIKISNIVLKILTGVLCFQGKIQNDIIIIFILCKLLCYSALTNTPCAFNKNRTFSI